MAKINQVIAVEKGVKAQNHAIISDLYKVIQKEELFNGFHKQYAPKDEEGDTQPPQSKRVQYSAREVLKTLERSTSDLFEITARKDWSNCAAKADVVVDGVTLVEGAPVTYLLFLEKHVTDLRTFFSKIPVLDQGEKWDLDNNTGLYKTDVTKTQSTSKEQKPIVLYDATEHHPAQTQLITQDVVVGYWSNTRHSGALPYPEKMAVLERVEKLLRAIKMAREEANTADEVETPSVGQAIFQYLIPETKEKE